MAYQFKLADLGEGITEVEIRRWLVAAGERVEEHQTVVEVETDKALVEIPTPRAGRVLELHHAEGDTVAVGAVLLTLEEGAAAAETPAAQPAGPEAAGEERRAAAGIVGELPEAPAAPPAKPAPQTIKALPSVRALARELGVELADIPGSGPEGSITAEDVRRAVASRSLPKRAVPDGAGDHRKPLPQLRRNIARHLLEAQQLTAFVTTLDEFDVTRLWELKLREEQELAERELTLTFLPFFIKALQHALAEFPRFNAELDAEATEVIFRSACHVGIAVDTPEGLVVPVLRHVEQKSIVALAGELARLAERARERRLAREEMAGSTITVTNFGSYGGHFATPIINYPNVAILGCGRIRPKPWVHDDAIAIRRILPLSLTFDHRISDGAEACRFLTRIGRYLEDPGLLFIESV